MFRVHLQFLPCWKCSIFLLPSADCTQRFQCHWIPSSKTFLEAFKHQALWKYFFFSVFFFLFRHTGLFFLLLSSFVLSCFFFSLSSIDRAARLEHGVKWVHPRSSSQVTDQLEALQWVRWLSAARAAAAKTKKRTEALFVSPDWCQPRSPARPFQFTVRALACRNLFLLSILRPF